LSILSTLVALAVQPAFAQADVTRVVVMPFTTSQGLEAFGVGLAAALERSLNALDEVFVPPVGDAILFANRAEAAGEDAVSRTLTAFEAGVLISARLSGVPERMEISLAFQGPLVGEKRTASFSVAGSPAGIASELASRTIAALALKPRSGDLTEVQRIAEQTPSLPSLAAVGVAASRLPGVRLGDLEAAAQLDPDSSWVLAEYARLLALNGDLTQAMTVARSATAKLPTDVGAWVTAGIVALASGDRAAASNSFQRALTLNPAHALALAGAAEASPDSSKAVEQLQQALTSYPRLVDAYLALANLQENDTRALQVLRRGSDNLPDSIRLHSALIARAVALGDPNGALAYLQQVAQDPLATSPELYALAASLPAGSEEGALDFVRQGEIAFPTDPRPKLEEAKLLIRLDRLADAEGILRPLFADNQDNADIANTLAITQAKLGKIEEARATFEAFSGQSDTVQLNLAQLYLEAGQPRAAATTLEPLVAAHPDDPEIQSYYGLALGRLGQVKQALEALDTALQLDPQLAIAQRTKSLLEQQQALTGNRDIQLSPPAAQAFQEGLYALEQQQLEPALAAFQRARGLEDNPLLAFYEAYALQLLGRHREALPALLEAETSFPDSDIVLNNLGFTQLQLGRLDLALEHLGRAVELNPANAQAHLNLGLTYFQLGRFAEELSSWNEAVALDPSLEAAVSSLRKSAEEQTSQ